MIASLRASVRYAARAVALVLLAGFVCTLLMRYAPGFESDERELDASISDSTRQQLRNSRAGERNVIGFYIDFVRRAAAGDLGMSRSLGRPVAELLRERFPVTLRAVTIGLAAGWLMGIALALPGAAFRTPLLDVPAAMVNAALLSVPAAVLALATAILSGSVELALALIACPRVFRYARNLLGEAYQAPHVIAARSRGVCTLRLLASHVALPAAPQMLAVAGVSAGIVFGAAIPVEALCDSPGIGQLAWTAALGRDLPLLVNITLLVTALTVLANSAPDLFRLERRAVE
jgi:peptide/nickel transport system permease protein